MPINNDSLNKKLYDLLKVQGYDPVPKNSEGETTPVPEEADVFKFTFKIDGKPIGPAWITVDSGQQLRVYYDNEIMDGLSEDESSTFQSFTDFLKMLKSWSQRRQLGFDTENQDRLAGDMAQRTHMKRKEQIREGYYPMGKSASYNDAVPTIKIVLQHTRQIQEGEQRFRNIAKIFLENANGERILAPTTRPGIAQVYARHLAEGGVPNDDRWNHIKGLCEEYNKMAGFVRAVRGNQFNESAQRLVEAGLNHYTSLRESLGKMRGHRGYNQYFESWTPTLMETEGDESTLNELFVQETLDPRIESVMPILNKLSKNLGEMKEVKALEEWADSLLEGGDGGEASEETDGDTSGTAGEGGAEDNPLDEAAGAETLAHNQATEKSRLDAFDLDEADDAEAAHKKPQVPAFMRKQSGDPDWKTTTQDLEKAKERNISGKEGLAALAKRLDQIDEEEVEESGLQAYLGNKKYGKDGMDALRKAGREHASKEKMASIRAKYDKLDEEVVTEAVNPKIDADATEKYALKVVNDLMYDPVGSKARHLMRDAGLPFTYYNEADLQNTGVAKFNIPYVDDNTPQGSNGIGSSYDALNNIWTKYFRGKQAEGWLSSQPRQMPTGKTTSDGKKIWTFVFGFAIPRKEQQFEQQGVAEDLDANQKRVGQLGPTEKVKNNNIGKLVGANESVELSEMDKSQPSSDRGGESSGNPYAKGGKATPVKAKDAEKDAEKALNKSMDKAHKKDVKEGQEDLDAILRIIRK
jgi:hypothetical protein